MKNLLNLTNLVVEIQWIVLMKIHHSNNNKTKFLILIVTNHLVKASKNNNRNRLKIHNPQMNLKK